MNKNTVRDALKEVSATLATYMAHYDGIAAANQSATLQRAQAALAELDQPAEPVFVFVEEGCVTEVKNPDNTDANYSLIDFDCEENGDCPVCNEQREPDEVCPTCGYDESKGNALECAVKYIQENSHE